jgi:putative (di)nucleoside polyphosphate hydrolase
VPLEAVIEFKREVYQLALSELSRFVQRQHRAPLSPYGRGGQHRERDGREQRDGHGGRGDQNARGPRPQPVLTVTTTTVIVETVVTPEPAPSSNPDDTAPKENS